MKKKSDEENNIYLIDVKLTDKVKTWNKDYIKMLISLYKPDWEFNPPESVVKSSEIYINENNAVYKFVKENYVKTGNPKDYIILKNIKLSYQTSGYDQSKLKTLKESLEKEFNTNFIADKKIGKIKYTNVILGWKEIVEEEDEDDKHNLG